MDRSATYNNAGVRLMSAGNHSAALELFRGALESKLALERFSEHGRAPERCVTPDEMSDSDTSSTTSRRSRSSEDLPNELDSYLELSRNVPLPQHFAPSLGITTIPHTPLLQLGGASYEPYLYTEAFSVPEDAEDHSPFNTQAMSCRIVFNLALIHQLDCRTSAKAASFYEIAATLLSSLPEEDDIVLLRLVLLNNFGVWCFENAEGESMMACFEQLVDTLDEASSFFMDSAVLCGVQRNIQAFLTPMNGVSLAA